MINEELIIDYLKSYFKDEIANETVIFKNYLIIKLSDGTSAKIALKKCK